MRRCPGARRLTLPAALLAGALSATGCALPVYEATGNLDGGGGAPIDGGTAGAPCRPSTASGPGNQVWSHSFGGLQADSANAVAVDPEGNVAIGGSFRGAASFDGKHTLVAKGLDAYVAKYDPGGKHLWSRQAGGDGDQYVLGLGALADGSVVATGAFYETLDFGCEPSTSVGGDDMFVVMLDPCGNCVWQRTFGGAASIQYARGVAVDADGSVLLTGGFAGVVAFDPKAPLTTSGDKQNVFIVKLDRHGKHVWSLGFGDLEEDQYGSAIAVDPDGHVVVTGAYSGTLSFDDGSGDLQAGDGKQLFVVQRAGDGSPVWSRGFGGAGDQIGISIAVGPASAEPAKRGVVVTGSNTGALDFGMGSTPLASSWGSDGFVAELSYLGSTLWSAGVVDVDGALEGSRGDQLATTVALDAKGGVIVGGRFDGAVTVLGKTAISTGEGDVDAFLLRLDPAGAIVDLVSYGGASAQRAQAVALDPLSDVYVTGEFQGAIDLTGAPLESAGDLDIFLAKLP